MSLTADNGRNVSSLDVERAVRERYSSASQAVVPQLCCPVDYDTNHLKVLPQELIDRDYGCGDPSKHVAKGETVLDLGSGGGKICYIASQVVGPQGKVIGVDVNDDMLALARKYQSEIAEKIGWNNVSFHKGRIQDLALDLDRFERRLAERPIRTASDWMAAQAEADRRRVEEPMIPDDSIDVVVSNCVLNLVKDDDRRQLFAEMFRVLKRGGRAVISDIVSDEPAPDRLRNDPELWSGCISGAWVEERFIREFETAGFYGVEVLSRQEEAWAVVEGIEFRSLTVQAYKGKEGPCMDHNEAVIYKGPWKSVTDDDGHVLRRGVRTAVCRKTFEIYNKRPYAADVIPVQPAEEVPAENAKPFDCRRNVVRSPQETKTGAGKITQLPVENCCDPGDCC